MKQQQQRKKFTIQQDLDKRGGSIPISSSAKQNGVKQGNEERCVRTVIATSLNIDLESLF